MIGTTWMFYAQRRLWCMHRMQDGPPGERYRKFPQPMIDAGYCLDRPDSRVEHRASPKR